MQFPILVVTGVYSFIGVCLNSTVLYLLLVRGRQSPHLVFAIIPFACGIWDLGVLLEMLRNAHLDELALYGQIISYPAILIGAAMFHFAHLYTKSGSRWVVGLFWVVTALAILRYLFGYSSMAEGTLSYSWGNIHKTGEVSLVDILVFAFWYAAMWLSIWLLVRFRSRAVDPLQRRHATYLIAGYGVVSVATIKMLLIMGVDLPLLLPLGMALTDVFGVLMAVAILKDRFLDITVIVKRTAIYSVLAAAVVIVFSLCEHVLATYVAEFIGEESQFLHLISVALVIALAMPLKHQVERGVETVFARRMVQL